MAEPTQAHYDLLGFRIAAVEKLCLARFRAALVVQIATLRLLIERNIVTVDEAILRIEETQRDCPEIFDSEEVASEVQSAIDLLRGEVPLHGSIVDRAVQRAKRKAKQPKGPVAAEPLGQTQVSTQPRRR